MQLQVDRGEKEEGQGEGGLAPSSAGYSGGASGSRMGPGPDSGSSAPSSVPQSLATSRDDEDDEDEESSGRRSNGHGGSRLVIRGVDRPLSLTIPFISASAFYRSARNDKTIPIEGTIFDCAQAV